MEEIDEIKQAENFTKWMIDSVILDIADSLEAGNTTLSNTQLTVIIPNAILLSVGNICEEFQINKFTSNQFLTTFISHLITSGYHSEFQRLITYFKQEKEKTNEREN